MESLRSAHAHHQFEVAVQDDPGHSMYALLKEEAEASQGDSQIIDTLEQQGVDLTEKHPLIFYLYFPSEEQARMAARELDSWADSVEVRPAADRAEWLVRFSTRGLCGRHQVAHDRRVILGFAKTYGGDFDGWEVAVDPLYVWTGHQVNLGVKPAVVGQPGVTPHLGG